MKATSFYGLYDILFYFYVQVIHRGDVSAEALKTSLVGPLGRAPLAGRLHLKCPPNFLKVRQFYPANLILVYMHLLNEVKLI